jgi:hypothetical protein
MADSLHPAASQHLPSFITAPGDSDVLMTVMSVVMLLAVLGFGVLFFRLHTLPERIAHKSQKVQFEIVAVLGLLALFTHVHLFWVAGLLLAFIDLPDFSGSLGRIAGSVEKIAGTKPGEGAAEVAAEVAPGPIVGDKEKPEAIVQVKKDDGAADAPRDGTSKQKDAAHA